MHLFSPKQKIQPEQEFKRPVAAPVVRTSCATEELAASLNTIRESSRPRMTPTPPILEAEGQRGMGKSRPGDQTPTTMYWVS